MDLAKLETFKSFTVLNKTLLFLIKLNETAVQSEPTLRISKSWVYFSFRLLGFANFLSFQKS